MKLKPSTLLLCGLLGGCATPANPYLQQVSIVLPPESQKNMSDRLEADRGPQPRSADSPFNTDFPASRVLTWHQPAAGSPRLMPNAVRYYDLTGLSEDRSIIPAVKRLEKAIRERKSASRLRALDQDLPLYPPQNAGFLVQDKISYEPFEWGSGVFFLAQFTQSRGMFPNNRELTYQFQGISKDRRLFVCAMFNVTNPVLPSSLEAVPQTDTIDDDAEEMAKQLDRQPDSSFIPDLGTIRSWVGSIKIPR
ncbi:MAG: hypothetical protein EOP85_15915 [Verrucomicrobiaceae bacterium]|nr:MAG: hypothetical protein EOP85_15915 [Verrucomicrobiaceae bacterium]